MWGRNWFFFFFSFTYFYFVKKKGGGSTLNIFSIFYAHHRIPNKHMTINFDTITNNYEVIYVIKTVMKYYLKKNRYEFSSASSKYGSTFICRRHYMKRFGLWIFMSKITHDFWLWWVNLSWEQVQQYTKVMQIWEGNGIPGKRSSGYNA
jgi:hypothetical protein